MNPTELGAGGHGGAAGSGSPGDSSGGSGGAGGGSAGTGGSGGGVGGVSGDGLPSEVEQLLTTYCVSCHGTRLAGGAPMALVTYADLTAPDPSQPAKSAAAVSLARMSNSAAPMPPSAPMPSASAIAAFASWVNAGTPATSCGGSDGGVDGGSSDPLGAAPTCTSGKSWPNGNTGSSSMNPGLACISCHNANNGPRFTIAGTVYPTGHEPDLCNGTNQAKVVITDAAGKQVTLTPNSVGNFSSTTTLKLPYKAQLVIGTSVRAMASAQTSGDCNSCHTQSGSSGAPGRVTTPAL